MIMISKFLFNFSNFYIIICFFLTKLLVLGISFSTAVSAEVIAKPVILAISFLTSFIFILRLLLVAKLLISGILSLIFFTLASYSVYLTTSLLTKLLNLIKSAGTGANLSTSNLSTSVFKLATFVFNAKLEVSTCIIFLISSFVA